MIIHRIVHVKKYSLLSHHTPQIHINNDITKILNLPPAFIKGINSLPEHQYFLLTGPIQELPKSFQGLSTKYKIPHECRTSFITEKRGKHGGSEGLNAAYTRLLLLKDVTCS
ncbi:hypothetical protein J22TS3_30700 [Paenibacillus sp. J22TS3]|nr:hypothetical protein J22TS3_30700 [Paenibacillus sp. J22TS3]